MKSLILAILFFNLSYSQGHDESKSLFKLGLTPFISKSKLNLNLTYGINYGSPSLIIRQWSLPNDKKQIMFNNIIGSISIGNKIEAYVNYINGYSLAYNYSYIGTLLKNDKYVYGVKWKLFDTENYIPSASIGINSANPISLAIGSSINRLKYYLCVDWEFFYVPYPFRYSIGVAYSALDYLTLFAEVNYQAAGDVQTPTQSARTGINMSIFNYVHFDVALFYFGFKFTKIIPGRNGFTWQNPENILTMIEKNNYFLLSTSVYVNLDLIK